MYFIKKSQVIVAETTKNHIQMKNRGHISAPVAFGSFPCVVSSRMGLVGQGPTGPSDSPVLLPTSMTEVQQLYWPTWVTCRCLEKAAAPPFD